MGADDLVIDVDGRTITVSNPDKLLFPQSGIRKADLARYYDRIGPVMLPHVVDRPITLVRYPQGVSGKGFFQKNTPDHYPDWIRRVELEKKGGFVNHCVVDDRASLVYFAQQNVITPHIGLARTGRLGGPDLFAIDLDPSTDDFEQIARVALGVRDALEQAGLAAFIQLTGSKGVHIVAPLEPTVRWSDVQRFGNALSTLLMERFSGDLTREFAKAERGDRIYLDMGRNNYQATIAAPYGVRAFEGAPVVTPIDWAELEDPGLTARRYDIETVFDRLESKGDPWADLVAAAKPLPGGG
ncbi:MAG: non-homologous end-joining DNA ligase [Acidimicrobiales bacterium]